MRWLDAISKWKWQTDLFLKMDWAQNGAGLPQVGLESVLKSLIFGRWWYVISKQKQYQGTPWKFSF